MARMARHEAERMFVSVIVHTSVAVAELAAHNLVACEIGIARLAPASFTAPPNFRGWYIKGAALW